MKILILGDVVGNSGVDQLKENLDKIIQEKKIDFTIVNGENAAEDGKGITKEITKKLFNIGVDVLGHKAYFAMKLQGQLDLKELTCALGGNSWQLKLVHELTLNPKP